MKVKVLCKKLFDKILSEIDDEWLMADILELPPTNDLRQLYEEFNNQYKRIFTGTENEKYLLLQELIYRKNYVKELIGQNNINKYKGVYVVNSLREYIDILASVKSNEGERELWFRGQIDAKYTLTPNIMRYAKEVATQFGDEYKPKPVSWHRRGQKVQYPNATKMLDEFKKLAKDKTKFEVNNDFEWLYLAQHYGMLTPLLDWSEDPLVALFFALDGLDGVDKEKIGIELEEFEKFSRISEAAAVYILDPGKVNENSQFVEFDENGEERDITYPISINDNNYSLFEGYIYGKYCFPICLKAPKREYRICKQSGNFLCQGNNIQPIDTIYGCRNSLYKIYIPYAVVRDIKSDLNTLNINSNSIYGEETLIVDCANKARTMGEKDFFEVIEDLNRKHTNFL